MSDPRTRVELERSIEEHPDDLDLYLVLADALGSAGSRHGELIMLQARADQTRDEQAKKVLVDRFESVLRDLRPMLLSPSVDTDQPLFDLSWRWGFIEKLTVRYWHHAGYQDAYRELARVLASTAIRFLRALKVVEATPTLLELLAQTTLPVVSELELQGLAPTLQGPFGPLDAIDQAFPRLKRLRLESLPVIFGEAMLRGLEALHLRGVDPALDTGAWLAGAPWPALTELEVNLGSLPQVTAATFPALKSLHLWLGSADLAAIAVSLLRRPLQRLRVTGPDPHELASSLASLPRLDVEWLELEVPAAELPDDVRRALPRLTR